MQLPLTAIAIALLAALSSPSRADTVYVNENEVPRPIDVARALAGPGFQPALKRRGLMLEATAPAQRMAGDNRMSGNAPAPKQVAATPAQATAPASQPAAAPAAQPVTQAAPQGGTLAVAVAFAFGSSELTPQSRAQLDGIAEGLKLLKGDALVMIEGHTDSIGADDYNRVLSERRAAAVKQYLVVQHGIAGARLATTGKGESEPLADTPPNAARNRRVAFHLG